MSTPRIVRLLTITSLLAFFSCVCFAIYTDAIRQARQGAVVEEWLDLVFERRHLEGLNSTGVLISQEEYQHDLEDLAVREQRIVSELEFPNRKEDLNDFLMRRATGNQYSAELRGVLFLSALSLAAGCAWLHGHSTGARA